MITMIKTYSTPDEFLTAEIALWGFEEIERLFALGAAIVPDEDKGFTWSFPALDNPTGVC